MLTRIRLIIQMLIIMLLPVLATGVGFELRDSHCCAEVHACDHAHESDAMHRPDCCCCRHHHHHEKLQLMLDAGLRSEHEVCCASVRAGKPAESLSLGLKARTVVSSESLKAPPLLSRAWADVPMILPFLC